MPAAFRYKQPHVEKLVIECPNCQSHNGVDPGLIAGSNLKCGKCKRSFTIGEFAEQFYSLGIAHAHAKPSSLFEVIFGK